MAWLPMTSMGLRALPRAEKTLSRSAALPALLPLRRLGTRGAATWGMWNWCCRYFCMPKRAAEPLAPFIFSTPDSFMYHSATTSSG